MRTVSIHILVFGWGWLARACYFSLWPLRVSATLSTVSLTLAFAWSALPSFFKCRSSVRLPAASFRRPLALSTCLSVVVGPSGGFWVDGVIVAGAAG
jgi:cytochrome bd-type quinol oxidase subunit 1